MGFRAAFLPVVVGYLSLPAAGTPAGPAVGPAAPRPGPGPAAKGLLIQAFPSRRKVYAGQPFTVSYRLAYQIPVIDPQNEIDLKFKNCWVEEYPPSAAKKQAASASGPKIIELKRYLLIPQLPGNLSVPVLTQRYRVTVPPDPDSFFGEEKITTISVRSRPTSVAVVALPSPPDSVPFSNAVGTFTFGTAYAVSKKSDNLLTFTLTVNGSGNLKNVRLAPPPLPAGVDVFNVAGRERHVLTDSTLQATYVFSFDLVANRRGTYALPGMMIQYFDPDRGRYVRYAAPGRYWAVTNPGLPLLPPADASRRARAQKHGLYTKATLHQDRDLFVGTRLFYLLTGLLALAGLTSLAYYRYAEHQAANAAMYRFRDARNAARRALKQNERNHYPHDLDAFAKGLHVILLTYLSHKFRTPEKIDSITEVSWRLQAERVSGKLREETVAALRHLERLRFFRAPPVAASPRALGDAIGRLVDEFEYHCHATSGEKSAFCAQQLAAVFLPGKK